MQERESRLFGCTLCGYWRPRDPAAWWCAWPLASWAAALPQGQRDAQPHRGGETRGQGIVQCYGGERGDTHLGTSSWLRGRVGRSSKSSHFPQNRRQLCPFNVCCQCQAILLIRILPNLNPVSHHLAQKQIITSTSIWYCSLLSMPRCFSLKQCIFKKSEVHP